MTVTSIAIPHMAAKVVRLHHPDLAQIPLLIGTVAVSPDAAKKGVKVGMQLRHAQAIEPDIRLVPYIRFLHQQARDEVEAILHQHSEFVERSSKQKPQWYIGFDSIGIDGVRQLSTEIMQQLQHKTSFSATTGVSSGKFPSLVANTAATTRNPVIVISSGSEAQFLKPYSISFLPLEAKQIRFLKHLGIRTIGQFAAMPRSAVFAQFGKAGVLVHELAQGKDKRQVEPAKPREIECVVHQLDTPVDNCLILENLVSKMALQMSRRLRKLNRMGRELALGFVLENGETLEQYRNLTDPITNVRDMRSHLTVLLEKVNISSGVKEIVISVSDLLIPTGGQLSLFNDHSKRAAQLHDTLQHLAKRYGENTFYQVSLLNSESLALEERFRVHGVDFD